MFIYATAFGSDDVVATKQQAENVYLVNDKTGEITDKTVSVKSQQIFEIQSNDPKYQSKLEAMKKDPNQVTLVPSDPIAKQDMRFKFIQNETPVPVNLGEGRDFKVEKNSFNTAMQELDKIAPGQMTRVTALVLEPNAAGDLAPVRTPDGRDFKKTDLFIAKKKDGYVVYAPTTNQQSFEDYVKQNGTQTGTYYGADPLPVGKLDERAHQTLVDSKKILPLNITDQEKLTANYAYSKDGKTGVFGTLLSNSGNPQAIKAVLMEQPAFAAERQKQAIR